MRLIYGRSTIPNGPIIEKIFQHHAYISKITVLILQYTMQTKVTSFMFTQKGYNTGYTVGCPKMCKNAYFFTEYGTQPCLYLKLTPKKNS